MNMVWEDDLLASWRSLPFTLHRSQDFEPKSVDWISDAFYEKLPDHGYEIRDEQIFTAFHMNSAYIHRQKLFAEAGLGTGKTFAYLIGAILYARFIGKPAIIACGSMALVEQLMHADGDITKLSSVLDVDIDARAALDPTQYVCARKVREVEIHNPRKAGLKALVRWAKETELGARTEVPHVSDELWNLVRWEEGLACGECAVSYRCPVLRARGHYRKAMDLIVCTHSFYFQHIRLREALTEQGNLPLLPLHSAIVFDEAHRIEDDARRALGEELRRALLLETFDKLMYNGMRETFARLLGEAERSVVALFDCLEEQGPAQWQKTALRQTVEFSRCVASLREVLATVMDELAVEEGLSNYTEEEHSIGRRVIWTTLNRVEDTLYSIVEGRENGVIWLERDEDDDLSLWVAPFDVAPIMQNSVYEGELPVIFSSATLANGASFDYLKQAVGAEDAAVMQVASPYDYANQCMVYIPTWTDGALSADNDAITGDDSRTVAIQIVELLEVSKGRALVLFKDVDAMESVRKALLTLLPDSPWLLLWEGEGTTAHLLSLFTHELSSVLFGVSLWEGISVAGLALSHCIIVQLPFPMDDPIVAMKRETARSEGLDPFEATDVPDMALKLKQGAGRLIRSGTDYGVISCLDTSFRGTTYERDVLEAFPTEARIVNSVDAVADFLKRFRGLDD